MEERELMNPVEHHKGSKMSLLNYQFTRGKRMKRLNVNLLLRLFSTVDLINFRRPVNSQGKERILIRSTLFFASRKKRIKKRKLDNGIQEKKRKGRKKRI